MKLDLSVLTPEGEVLRDEVDEVIAPTTEGEIGILPNHISLLSRISPGELKVQKGGKTSFFVILGGFIEINNNKVTVLGDYAVRAEDIEIAKAEQAKKRAETLMKEKVSTQDFAEIEAQLRKSLLELKVARRRSGGVKTVNS